MGEGKDKGVGTVLGMDADRGVAQGEVPDEDPVLALDVDAVLGVVHS